MADTTKKPVIFLAFANDRDDTVNYLRNLPEEARQIREPLQRARRDGLCELVELANATADDIFRVFQDPEYRDRIAVFHYGGHANGYQLLLESASGSPHAADAGGLAAFFGQQRGLDLVFLNGCSTQQQVQGLLDANVSVVIATSRAIDDQVAMQFSKLFYQGLAGGASIRTAYKEAEAAVQTSRGGNTRGLYFGDADKHAPKETSNDRWPWELYLRSGAESVANWSLPDAVGDPLFGLPPLPPQDLPDSPFRHLNWFDREHAEVFFGRGHQIRELYDLVTSPGTAPIVLLYGQSGVGKSSMLAAGLVPRLEQTCAVRYLRRDQQLGLLETVRGAFIEEGTSVSVTKSMHFAQDWLEAEQQLGKPLVIIVDQVEEIVTRPNPNLPQESTDFLNALESIFGKRSQRPAGRLILGFRKEWLAEVEARLAEHKLPRAKVFLERLGRLGVIEAVQGPTRSPRLRDQYGLTVEEGLAEIIADDLLSDDASAIAPTLQILLTKMWTKATEADYEHPRFSQQMYQSLKREGLLLRDFLDQQIEQFRQRYPQAVNSGLLLDLLAFHTTPLGTAGQCSLEQLQPAYSGVGHELSDLLQQSQDLYLLTTATDANRETSRATRLSHDTLAPLVRERFDKADEPGQRARRVLVNRVPDWQNGKEGQPLDETDLAIVEAGRTGMRQWTADEQRLVAASCRMRTRRNRGRRLLQLAGVAAVGMIALFGVLAFWQARIAQRNTVTAHFLVAGAASEKGLPAEALYWFWRAYSDATPNDPRRLNARNLIASWSRSVGQPIHHDDSVVAAAFSPDSRTVLTGCLDGTARLWDAATGNAQGEPLRHKSAVTAVAFSPDGQTLLTASKDQTAQCWSTATGQPMGQSLPHAAAVTAIAFRQDGKTVLTGCQDGTVWFWDAVTGMPRGEPLRLPGNSATALAFSADGRMVLTANENNSAQLFNVETGEPCGQLLSHKGTINAAAFSPDGMSVLTGSSDRTARLWDTKTGTPNGEPFYYSQRIFSVAFSPDGSMVLTGSGDNTSRLWDVATRKIIGEPLRHEGAVAAVSFSPNGQRIITASWDNTAALWEFNNPQEWDVLGGYARGEPLKHGGSVTSVAFSPDGRAALTGCSDNKARLWSTATGELMGNPLSHDGAVNAVVFSGDGKILLTGSQDQTARLWDTATGQPRGQPLQHKGSVLAVAFSPDGRTVITGSKDNTARLWDAITGQSQEKILQHGEPVNSVAFGPNGRFVLTGSDDHTARIWNVATGQPHGKVLAHTEPVRSVAFSPDGQTVITGSDDRKARLWETATGKPRGEDLLHNEAIRAVTFSPDGQFAITCSEDNTAVLWDAVTGQPRGEPMRHNAAVHAMAVSPDSHTIVTVGTDNTARVWDAVTGQPRGEPLRHEDDVRAVAFSPNGQTVITGSDDGTARMWNVPPPAQDEPARLALSVVVRTGYYTDSRGIRRSFNQAQWLDRKRQLDALGGPCGIRRWEDLTPAELKVSRATLPR
ncbi:MAG: AAA family ATPase [Planctomycetota bacterium]